MIICLVTDRHRLGARGLTDVGRRCVIDQARFAIDAGVDFIQVRERDLEASDLAALVSEILGASRGSRTRVIVNDRLDVALACGADGVHLRGDSMPADAVRRLAPAQFLVGRSVHSREEALAAGPVDYLVAGTVFQTPSKPDKTAEMGTALLGANGLATIVHATSAPVLAIGGIGFDQLRQVAASGAAGIAAIGLFMNSSISPDRSCRAIQLERLVSRIRAEFDTPEPAS